MHDAIVVGDSPIAGRGLFAHTAIDEGTAHETSAHYVDIVTVSEDVHLVLPTGTTVHYGNHGCDPNLWHVGPYDIATRRPVRAGEELTMDYGTQTGAPGFSMPCHCGAADCRGEVTSEDWRRADLQVRYAGHWVPALEARIASGG